MQVGANDSAERRRADEIYEFVAVPVVEDAGLKPYRADLDLSPGAITQKMLSELLGSRVVIKGIRTAFPALKYAPERHREP